MAPLAPRTNVDAHMPVFALAQRGWGLLYAGPGLDPGAARGLSQPG